MTPGKRLVTAAIADQGVIGEAMDHGLDGVGDQLAREQGELHPLVVHTDAVGDRDRREFIAACRRILDTCLGCSHLEIVRHVAGRLLTPSCSTTPTMGLARAASSSPIARMNARCGARVEAVDGYPGAQLLHTNIILIRRPDISERRRSSLGESVTPSIGSARRRSVLTAPCRSSNSPRTKPAQRGLCLRRDPDDEAVWLRHNLARRGLSYRDRPWPQLGFLHPYRPHRQEAARRDRFRSCSARIPAQVQLNQYIGAKGGNEKAGPGRRRRRPRLQRLRLRLGEGAAPLLPERQPRPGGYRPFEDTDATRRRSFFSLWGTDTLSGWMGKFAYAGAPATMQIDRV